MCHRPCVRPLIYTTTTTRTWFEWDHSHLIKVNLLPLPFIAQHRATWSTTKEDNQIKTIDSNDCLPMIRYNSIRCNACSMEHAASLEWPVDCVEWMGHHHVWIVTSGQQAVEHLGRVESITITCTHPIGHTCAIHLQKIGLFKGIILPYYYPTAIRVLGSSQPLCVCLLSKFISHRGAVDIICTICMSISHAPWSLFWASGCNLELQAPIHQGIFSHPPRNHWPSRGLYTWWHSATHWGGWLMATWPNEPSSVDTCTSLVHPKRKV